MISGLTPHAQKATPPTQANIERKSYDVQHDTAGVRTEIRKRALSAEQYLVYRMIFGQAVHPRPAFVVDKQNCDDL